MNSADIRQRIEKVIPANSNKQTIVEKILNIVHEETADAQFVATLQQEQWENLMRWMVRHPNDSLSDFIYKHCPSDIYEERLNKNESFESVDIS